MAETYQPRTGNALYARLLRDLAEEFTETADLAAQERCPEMERGNREHAAACLAGAAALEEGAA